MAHERHRITTTFLAIITVGIACGVHTVPAHAQANTRVEVKYSDGTKATFKHLVYTEAEDKASSINKPSPQNPGAPYPVRIRIVTSRHFLWVIPLLPNVLTWSKTEKSTFLPVESRPISTH